MDPIRSLRLLALALAVIGVAASCGNDDRAGGGASTEPSAPPPLSREPTSEPDPGGGGGNAVVPPMAARMAPDPSSGPELAGNATAAFGIDLLDAVAADTAPGQNVIVSPVSVAVALAMLEPGALGDAQTQLRDLLRIVDAEAFHASMNALEQSLESRVAQAYNSSDIPGEVTVRIANAAYLHQGYPFEQAYLDAIGTHYGPALNTVDFALDPDAVAHEINRFVADVTNDRIPDLVPDGTIPDDTVLALVNALYLNASWLEVFDASRTAEEPFTRLDSVEVSVPLMRGSSDASARGDGWVAATKSYVGGLAVQFILPDDGRFDDVAANLAAVINDAQRNGSSGAKLAVPRFETRFHAELSPALQSLGLTAPYVEGKLLGIADDRRLVLDQAIHETFVAMDETGTEAAAATAILARPSSGPILPPVPVILDRPFIFRIFDYQSGATLFLGHIHDPVA